MTDRRIHTDSEEGERDSNDRDAPTIARGPGESTVGLDPTDASRTRRSLLATAGSALAATLAGCATNPWAPDPAGSASDDAAPNETANDDTAPNETASDDTAPDETTSERETDSADTETVPPLEREPAQVVEVASDGFQFDPGSFEIDAGETVHWIWKEGGHNVRVREKPDGSDWTGTPGTASDTYGEGYEHGHTFETPGEYVYFCAPHQTLGLVGSFTVR